MQHGLDDAVFAFLNDPATHDADKVELIETHAACVFLASERALKVRKSVRYPYLDFSSLEKRRVACERELELNRPNAPELYEGLVWITRAADGVLTFGGEGERIEPCVRMRRFDQSDLLSRMAEDGRLSLEAMRPLARAVRAAHDSAPLRRAVRSGTALTEVLDGNLASFRQHDDVFGEEAMARLETACRNELQSCAGLLDRRADRGFVRRCHGDLHLANIVMWRGETVLFDALEFDEALAEIDVLYDLAFLLMDLLSRDMKAHANALLNAYLGGCETSALDGLAALPLLLSLRAQVRAKVAADRGDPEEARRYFQLGKACLNRDAARLIAVGGLSGTGKSTLARNLAPPLGGPCGALVLRSDVERKAMLGADETDRLGEDAYRPDVTAAVYTRLVEKTRAALQAGESVILDAVYARPDERAAAKAVAEIAGAPFAGLWLEAEAAVLKQRVTDRRNDASDANAAIVERQLGYDLGVPDWTRIDAGEGAEATLMRARAALGL